jgi:hypothetical protein
MALGRAPPVPERAGVARAAGLGPAAPDTAGAARAVHLPRHQVWSGGGVAAAGALLIRDQEQPLKERSQMGPRRAPLEPERAGVARAAAARAAGWRWEEEWCCWWRASCDWRTWQRTLCSSGGLQCGTCGLQHSGGRGRSRACLLAAVRGVRAESAVPEEVVVMAAGVRAVSVDVGRAMAVESRARAGGRCDATHTSSRSSAPLSFGSEGWCIGHDQRVYGRQTLIAHR